MRAIKLAREELADRPSLRRARVDANLQQPRGAINIACHELLVQRGVCVFYQRHFDQVWAFPLEAQEAEGREIAGGGPVLEVGARVEGDGVELGVGDGHDPALGGSVP